MNRPRFKLSYPLGLKSIRGGQIDLSGLSELIKKRSKPGRGEKIKGIFRNALPIAIYKVGFILRTIRKERIHNCS